MSEIRLYVLVDEDDNEVPREYTRYSDAEQQARHSGCAVVAQVYEYADSELVWTPNGDDTWPPRKENAR